MIGKMWVCFAILEKNGSIRNPHGDRFCQRKSDFSGIVGSNDGGTVEKPLTDDDGSVWLYYR